MIRLTLALSGLALVAACASSTTTTPTPDAPPAVSELSKAELAMKTARDLAAAGNEQIAINRLTQALGNPDLSDAERLSLLELRGQLRAGDGNDVWGAIADYETLVELSAGTPKAPKFQEMLDVLRGEATSLNFRLETGELTRSERFATLFRLGEHDDARDMLMDGGVTAEPGVLLDMYQIGYLCDGEGFTGPAFDIVEPDGTARTVRFCDFGK